jgi:alkanesulfonate monooxygenase SsuD/methylene tetrahydromethanopterin reductase-like flavin-dependent oxidoreductase (luciferase family)
LPFLKDCGVMVEPQEGIEAVDFLSLASTAEELGFGYFLRSDHLTTRRIDLFPECWASLGAIAMHTKTISFGPLVSPVGFRNPALLARMACTVDSLSPGRLQLGVGAGHVEDEYIAHGFEFPPFKVRRQQFRESLRIIRSLTQTGTADFSGKYYSAHISGSPGYQRKIRLVIGGKSPSIAREAVQYADEWNCTLPLPPTFSELLSILAKSDRHIDISRMGGFIIAETSEGVREQLRGLKKKRGVGGEDDAFLREMKSRGWIIGTPREFADSVNHFRDLGFEKIYFQMWQMTDRAPLSLLADTLKEL